MHKYDETEVYLINNNGLSYYENIKVYKNLANNCRVIVPLKFDKKFREEMKPKLWHYLVIYE